MAATGSQGFLKAMLNIGDKAPDFIAPMDEGLPFRLSEWAGVKHVVLYFYPRDFTIGCTKEACDFRDNYEALQHEGAILVGVSSDDPESHRRFKEKYSLPFPLAADVDQAVSRSYDVLRRFLPGAQRVTYVIDIGGVIRGAFRHELAIGRHQDDVLQTLRVLNHKPG